MSRSSVNLIELQDSFDSFYDAGQWDFIKNHFIVSDFHSLKH